MIERRAILTGGLAVAIAGCAAPSPPREPRVMVRYLRAPDAVIEVSVVGPALATATLIDGEGKAIQAGSIVVEREGSAASPDIGVGVGGGSRSGVSTGVFIGIPILTGRTERVTSRARVPVGEVAGYREAWRAHSLRLTFGDPSQTRPIDVPAPEPM